MAGSSTTASCVRYPASHPQPRNVLSNFEWEEYYISCLDIWAQQTGHCVYDTSSERGLLVSEVSVITPEKASDSGWPIVVWIHGGGYEFGYAAAFDGAELVADSQNTVIAIVIQYRLGAFGFLSGNEIKEDGALNAGLLDQAYALEWVQKNIALFDGDPNKVTIWGESAGAGSVIQHIVANGGNTQPPLFRGAITSSTYLPPQYYYNDRIPQFFYDELVSMSGCGSSSNTLSCLRTVDATTIQKINYYLAGFGFYDTFVFVPVVDGTFILESPTVTLAKGVVNGKMLLAVGNTYEGNSFVNENETLSITDYVAQLFPDMTPLQVKEAEYMYKSSGTPVGQAVDVMGDSLFVCPTYYLLQAFEGRSWKGLFAIPPAFHGWDIPYYFNIAPAFNNTEFIDAFSQSFMSFVRTLDVNAKIDPTNITPYWPKYYIGRTEMVFNKTETDVPLVAPIMTSAETVTRCAFWATVRENTAQ